MVNFAKIGPETASKFQEDISLNDSAKTAWNCHHPLNFAGFMKNDGEYEDSKLSMQGVI